MSYPRPRMGRGYCKRVGYNREVGSIPTRFYISKNVSLMARSTFHVAVHLYLFKVIRVDVCVEVQHTRNGRMTARNKTTIYDC